MGLFRHSCALLPLLLLAVAGGIGIAEPIDLSPSDASPDVARVMIEVEAGGHTLIRPTTESAETPKEQQLPMSVSAKLVYDELRLASAKPYPAIGTQRGAPLAIRHYDTANAVLKIGDSGRTPQLSERNRLIVLSSDPSRPRLYCPTAALAREQLDLIDVVGNTLLVDELLPVNPVSNGDTWSHDVSLMRPFLTLDNIAVCEVQSVLESHNDDFAKARLAGVVHGMADGAATELDIRGIYLFDRKLRRVTRLNLAMREKRSIGAATPGVDAIAKMQIQIESLEKSSQLTDAVVREAMARPTLSSQDVLYEAAPLGFRVKHDRHWYLTGQQRESITLRRLDGADLVAQCTLTVLPPKSAGRQLTLEQFQKDVRYSLGKSFGELVSARQWQNAAGHFCYELVVRGVVEEVPVEWHYYLIAPESGHRVSAAVTIEKTKVERLGIADRELVESLELFPRMPEVRTAASQAQAATK